ncbi:MAG: hypothetical protein RLZZ387_3516, partial [Chloroflexota bacterium]
VTLPGGVSVTELYRAALERGVAFVPGDVFFAGGTSQVAMRLSFSSQPPEVLADVGALLGGLLSERQSVRAPKLPALPERVAVQ